MGLDTSIGPQQTQVVVDLLVNKAATYNYVASFTVICCDTLSTLPREVRYLWGSPWSSPKAMYFIARYYGLFAFLVQTLTAITKQTSLVRCRLFLWYLQAIGGGSFFVLLVNLIFIKRLKSLYHGKKWANIVLTTLIVCNFLTLLYAIAVLGRDVDRNVYLAPPGIPFYGCISNSTMAYLLPILILFAVTTLVIFCMTIWWYWLKYRSKVFVSNTRLPPLLGSIMKDGVAFFIISLLSIVGIGFLTLWIMVSGKGQYVLQFYTPWHTASVIFSGSRLILHLKEAGDKDAYWFSRSCLSRPEEFAEGREMMVSREIAFA